MFIPILFVGFLEQIIAVIANIIPRISIIENGSFQNIAPETVGSMKPMEYTVEHKDVFPVVKAAV